MQYFIRNLLVIKDLVDVFLTDHAKINSGTQGILILPQLKQETRLLPSGIAKYAYIFLRRQK